MKVAELQTGRIYKIRSDRATHVLIRNGWLDIHLGEGAFGGHNDESVKIRPLDYFVYLGLAPEGRVIAYRGQRLRAYPNIWRHIVPLDDDIS